MPIPEVIAAASVSAVKQIVEKLVIPKLTRLTKTVRHGIDFNFVSVGSHFGDYLKRTYEKNSIINTLVFHNQQKKLKELYIPLTLVQDGVDRTRETGAIRIEGYPTDFISTYRKVLITDTAGMGKSTLMKIMFLSAIDQEAGIPFFVELRRLTKDHLLLDEIRNQLDSLTKEFDDNLMRSFFQSGDFIFFLDGFDEIGLSDRKEVTEDIKQFIEKAPNNYFILSSRFEQALAGFGDFRAMKIKPLKQREAYSLLKKYDSDGEISKRLIEKLESGDYEKIKEFLQNPLLVSLLFIGFEYKPEIPLKINLFYDQVFEAYYNNHDLSKDGYFIREKLSGLDLADFAKVLRSIGYICLKKNLLEFNRGDFLEILSKAEKLSCVSSHSTLDLMNDLLHAVPLFCQDGVNYKWVHKSMQEYFAADFINRDCADKKEKILRSLAASPEISNFYNLLVLYADLDSKSFYKIFVLPVLEDFISYYESPVLTDNPEMEKRVRNRRQLIYNRDTYLYFFPKEDEAKSAPELFNFLRGIVGAGSTRSIINRNNVGQSRGVIYLSGKNDKLVDLIEKKIPGITTSFLPRKRGLFEYKFITQGKVYHYTEDFMIDNPEAYDELDNLAYFPSSSCLNYQRAKLELERIRQTLKENEAVFEDLLD